MNKLLTRIHFLYSILLLVGVVVALLLIEMYLPHHDLTHLFREFLIVIAAAFLVSAYFEFHLRKGISEENTRMFEIREEYGKAGVVEYYPNFKDIDLRSYFKDDIKTIEVYVNFAQTVLNSLQDKISSYCQRKDVELNIYLLSPKNKFIVGLGDLWGKSNEEYNEAGIRRKIDSSLNTLKSTFDDLKKQGKLNAKIRVALLERNPVFYSFYRFNDEMIYVPSKIVEPKSFIPLSFLVRKTLHSEGIFNKCIQELEIIKQDKDSWETYYQN